MDFIPIAQMIWQTLLFSMAVYAVTFAIRTLAEKAVPKAGLAGNYYWREVALPLLPPAAGCVLGVLVTIYPYPPGIESAAARAIYGAVCGLFSGVAYRVVKSFIKEHFTGPGSPDSTGEA